MQKTKSILIILTLGFLMSTVVNTVMAKNDHHGPRKSKIMEQLTDEQLEAIKNKVKKLWKDGVSIREIHKQVREMVAGYGIDIPERADRKIRGRKDRPDRDNPPPFEDLTNEQRRELRAKMKELHEQSASREEIQQEMQTLVKEYGIQFPQDFKSFGPGRYPRMARPLNYFTDQLSQEQRQTLHDKISQMKKEGASRDEIRQTVKSLLEEYGVDVPENFGKDRHLWHELSPEQRDKGATRDEIHHVVRQILDEMRSDPPQESSGQE